MKIMLEKRGDLACYVNVQEEKKEFVVANPLDKVSKPLDIVKGYEDAHCFDCLESALEYMNTICALYTL